MAALAKSTRAVSQSLLRLQTDTRLAELARDGHEPAFDALVRRYRPELVRASSRIVGPDRSEDAVQQALLNAHCAIDTTENVQNIRAWLHTIGQNSSLNLLRSVRDEVPFDDQRHIASTASAPAETAALSERLRETLAAVDELPERQRAALLLREFEGRSHDDIAAALNLSPGAARQQLMRARQGVRRAVTAITPYPFIASLASPGTGAGLAELVFGVGASATAIKLGATVAATGAIAGGVFGASVTIPDRDATAAANPQSTHVAREAHAAASTRGLAGKDTKRGKDNSGHGTGIGANGVGTSHLTGTERAAAARRSHGKKNRAGARKNNRAKKKAAAAERAAAKVKRSGITPPELSDPSTDSGNSGRVGNN